MNEQLIEELAKQAGYMKDKYGLYHTAVDDIGGVDLEKFAELIVQECLVKIEVWEQDNRNHVSYLLKHHFGVKP